MRSAHFVLSTLHTNSAIGAFTRLVDIGVEPYLTASTVIATIAQRLIRGLCEECRAERPVTADERSAFAAAGVGIPEHVYDPVGCAACAGTGYRGRLPVIEVLEVDEPLREAIREGATDQYAGVNAPSETLSGHGLSLVAQGRTTFSNSVAAMLMLRARGSSDQSVAEVDRLRFELAADQAAQTVITDLALGAGGVRGARHRRAVRCVSGSRHSRLRSPARRPGSTSTPSIWTWRGPHSQRRSCPETLHALC